MFHARITGLPDRYLRQQCEPEAVSSESRTMLPRPGLLCAPQRGNPTTNHALRRRASRIGIPEQSLGMKRKTGGQAKKIRWRGEWPGRLPASITMENQRPTAWPPAATISQLSDKTAENRSIRSSIGSSPTLKRKSHRETPHDSAKSSSS